MAVLIDEDFSADAGGFSAGSQTSSEGWDFENGRLEIAGNTTATDSFTAVTSGTLMAEFWYYAPDTDTAADNSKDTFIYLLPTAGSVTSANSLATVVVSRNTTNSADSNSVRIGYRNGASFTYYTSFVMGRSAWFKIRMLVDFDAGTWDLYVNDVCLDRGFTVPNASASDISRFTVLNNTSAPTIYIDSVYVQSVWAFDDDWGLLVDHDFAAESGGQSVEDLTPDTNSRQINNQTWKIPDDQTTYGAFSTNSSNGLAPDSGKDCLAMVQCRPEGEVEVEFHTSVSSAIYLGVAFRVWSGLDNDGYLLFRYYSAGSNKFALFQGSTSITTSNAVTLSANTTYTLRVIMLGRLVYCYYKAAAIDSGSYTLVFSQNLGTSGDRGQLSEEHCGPLMANSIGGVGTDNYVRHFRFSGAVPSDETTVSLGDNTYRFCYGSVREWYNSDVAGTALNHFWSKGVQLGHRAEADMGNYATAQKTIFNTTECKSYRQRSLNIRETTGTGNSETWSTFTRRGAWFSDFTRPWDNSYNVAPDTDFLGELWDLSYRTCGDAGAANTDTNSGYHDWRDDVANDGMPQGFQRLTNAASGNKIRHTQICGNISGWTTDVHDLQAKYEGTGDPMSHVFTRQPANITAYNDYHVWRAVYVETGSLSLDGALLTEIRDDLANIATFTWTTGSSKTDAAGDANTDGFNERYGWYEVNAASDELDFTFNVGSYDRHYPQFRVNGWTGTETVTVTIGGSSASEGTDYWFDDLGDGTALLQINSVRSSNTAITLVDGGGGANIPAIMHHRRMMMSCNT